MIDLRFQSFRPWLFALFYGAAFAGAVILMWNPRFPESGALVILAMWSVFMPGNILLSGLGYDWRHIFAAIVI
jgi:hypothetical protein